LFDLEFPKNKQWFESIHNQQPLENVNTTSETCFQPSLKLPNNNWLCCWS
jgi:hypothetical protein